MLESLGNLAGAEFLPVRAFLGFFCKISTPDARVKVILVTAVASGNFKAQCRLHLFFPFTINKSILDLAILGCQI